MTMALVHEKLYQTDGLAQLDFAEYATGLLNYLWLSHGPGPGTEFQIIYNVNSIPKPIGTG
jgi:two-component sensor histidine kinase